MKSEEKNSAESGRGTNNLCSIPSLNIVIIRLIKIRALWRLFVLPVLDYLPIHNPLGLLVSQLLSVN